jgi:hypothetical protein
MTPFIFFTYFSVSVIADDFSLTKEEMQKAMSAIDEDSQTESALQGCECYNVRQAFTDAEWERLNDFKDIEHALKRIRKGKVSLTENVELHWKVRSANKANLSLVVPIKSN